MPDTPSRQKARRIETEPERQGHPTGHAALLMLGLVVVLVVLSVLSTLRQL